MTVTDEMLMAFADGALSADEAAAIEQAVAADPRLQRRVEAQRAVRSLVADAFAPALSEPVPQRLSDAVRHRPSRSGLPAWASLAAALVVGVLAGVGTMTMFRPGLTGGESGREARGPLRLALESATQAGAAPDAPVRVGLSFRSADAYCRTFQVAQDQPWAGVACKQGEGWVIEALAPTAPVTMTAYRQAGAELPAPLLQTVEAMIVGGPLDAQQELAAREKGWMVN